jgi:hypothetical protein
MQNAEIAEAAEHEEDLLKKTTLREAGVELARVFARYGTA